MRNRRISREKQHAVSTYDDQATKTETTQTTSEARTVTSEIRRTDILSTCHSTCSCFPDELDEQDTPIEIKREQLTPAIPNFAPYLIIGGGTTAMSAFKSIRAHDATAKVRR
jgi:hypothetical protein